MLNLQIAANNFEMANAKDFESGVYTDYKE